jgi:hypothetical protein
MIVGVAVIAACAGSCTRSATFDDSELVPVAAIKEADSSQVEAALEQAGIAATVDEGPVVYGISVAPSDKSKALSVLRADSASRQYWIQFSDDQ